MGPPGSAHPRLGASTPTSSLGSRSHVWNPTVPVCVLGGILTRALDPEQAVGAPGLQSGSPPGCPGNGIGEGCYLAMLGHGGAFPLAGTSPQEGCVHLTRGRSLPGAESVQTDSTWHTPDPLRTHKPVIPGGPESHTSPRPTLGPLVASKGKPCTQLSSAELPSLHRHRILPLHWVCQSWAFHVHASQPLTVPSVRACGHTGRSCSLYDLPAFQARPGRRRLPQSSTDGHPGPSYLRRAGGSRCLWDGRCLLSWGAPKHGIAGSQGGSGLHCWRTCQTVSRSVCISVHFHSA